MTTTRDKRGIARKSMVFSGVLGSMDTSLVNVSGEPSVVVRSRDPIIRIGSLVKRGGIMMIFETTVGVYPLSYGEALQGSSTASLMKVSCRATVKATTGLKVHPQQP